MGNNRQACRGHVMRLPRRLVLFVCSLVAAFIVLVAPALAFTDVPANQPYAAAIDGLAARGIISGHADGTFGPDELVSRCQFAKMIVNTLGIPHSDLSMPFTDVGPGDLPEFVAAASAHRITNGTNEAGTLFSPWGQASRAQVLTMVVRGMDSEYPSLLGYVPGLAGSWGPFDPAHEKSASTAWGNGLLKGLPPMASLDPWAPMPRGEVAQVLWNALDLIDHAVRATEVVDGNTVRGDYQGKKRDHPAPRDRRPGVGRTFRPRGEEPAGRPGHESHETLRALAVGRRHPRRGRHLLAYLLFDTLLSRMGHSERGPAPGRSRHRPPRPPRPQVRSRVPGGRGPGQGAAPGHLEPQPRLPLEIISASIPRRRGPSSSSSPSASNKKACVGTDRDRARERGWVDRARTRP